MRSTEEAKKLIAELQAKISEVCIEIAASDNYSPKQIHFQRKYNELQSQLQPIENLLEELEKIDKL